MRIFVIDDDPISLFLTKSLLDMAGFWNIETFLNAEDALGALFSATESTFPDIMLLDLNMPVMDGWEFLEALTPFCKTLKNKCCIYIVTSSQDPADIEKAEEYFMVHGLIHKPLTEEKIKEKLV